MTINDELREIEDTIAKRGPTGYEPQLLRIATEYRNLLNEAVGLLREACQTLIDEGLREWPLPSRIDAFIAKQEPSNDT